ncbi:MAG: hypothetical protein H8E85_01815 [Candidatus Marinimicrobia bacterium]|nr:hypothetical protein [Candidatus Neomarinimicrobiota bacterium]
MNKFTNEEKLHHYMGIEMNMQTWNLLGKENRNEHDDLRMINFAKASLFHWQNSPKFEPVNEQRGHWLISRVYAVLEIGEKALESAQETMCLTEQHNFKDFDLAYAYEAMARANAALGNKNECNNWQYKAEEAGELIKDSADKKYFDEDLKAEPWFGNER